MSKEEREDLKAKGEIPRLSKKKKKIDGAK